MQIRQKEFRLILARLCHAMAEETGLAFFTEEGDLAGEGGFNGQGLRTDKGNLVLISFEATGEEIKLLCLLPEGEREGMLTPRLLEALGKEVYMRLAQEGSGTQQTLPAWESILVRAVEERWNEEKFELEARECGLPQLPYGFPLLIRCQGWHREVPTVVRNLLPYNEVVWVNGHEVFLFITPENGDSKKPLPWAESLIQFIHTMLADELGVLATVLIGSPTDKRLWYGYQEVRELVQLQTRFFRGKPGLVAWKLGLAGLLNGLTEEKIRNYQGEAIVGTLSPELKETLETFLKHNLNLAEASRELYVHRNTLVYRLDRITELTGHNPRTFEDAVLLYLALWLEQHLHNHKL